ncbi:MAG: hypothetical protein UR14_C0002G0117 [candidate division TM6 bacterium GW2011_GWE2_31_21]|nr:MAG: hypothetical protein UR14_C0002G0117 [candidate division TM6 bacterium GW2011_GWE2_31_21]KKP53914.1 MAG: hypothetical protein UR43_C0002G0117 [candidate division TM6 bacterium GW2011_GWF2_33_332]
MFLIMTFQELFIVLVSNDMLKKSDAIILLEGDGFFRIDKALELYLQKWASFIVISGGIQNLDKGSFPAAQLYEALVKKNVNDSDIIIEDMSLNTREQAENIIKLSQENGWKRIIIVASHYHQYRAFLTFLKVVLDKKIDLEIINAAVSDLAWFENLKWGVRFELLKEEFEKIKKYKKVGHVATFQEAINYFKWKELQI